MHRTVASRPDQRGISLLEMLVASVIGIMAVTGILYLYKAQNRDMLVQGGISEMRMNGMFTLREARHYLMHAGMGLPREHRNLAVSGADLLVKMNSSKRFSPASMDAGSGVTRTLYRVPLADTALFLPVGFAVIEGEGKVVEAPIREIRRLSGQNQALVVLDGDKNRFPGSGRLYPMDGKRLHRCTGIGADTAAGDFRVMNANPLKRPGVRVDSLTLAEGIESLGYRYFLLNGDSLATLPANLDSLARIEITVVARSLIADRSLGGDGYRRQTFKARLGYRRTL